jgi:hypothetical protein
MQFLRHKWKFAAEQTVVCGDSGNDIALFAVDNEREINERLNYFGFL